MPSVKGTRGQTFLKRNLLIFSDRIFDSSVEAGIPSCAAAPEGPETRPPVAAKAVSITSLSSAGDFLATGSAALPGRRRFKREPAWIHRE